MEFENSENTVLLNEIRIHFYELALGWGTADNYSAEILWHSGLRSRNSVEKIQMVYFSKIIAACVKKKKTEINLTAAKISVNYPDIPYN